MRDKIFTSYEVAEKLGKRHFDLIKIIDALLVDLNKIGRDEDFLFSEKQKQLRGKNVRFFELNTSSYRLLLMRVGGKESLKQQMLLVESFFAMKDDLEKGIFNESELLHLYVDYISFQGFDATKKLEMLTGERFVLILFVNSFQPILDGFFDLEKKLEVNVLVLAEHIAKETIVAGMKEELHYKEINFNVKRNVKELAETMMIQKIEG